MLQLSVTAAAVWTQRDGLNVSSARLSAYGIKHKRLKKMRIENYLQLHAEVRARYPEDVSWAENVKPCSDADSFARQALWVILCSGFKEQAARVIEAKIYKAIAKGKPIDDIGHKSKAKAIKHIIENRVRLFDEYQAAEDKIEFLKSLPWIGDITKYHLAKNLGIDTAKPDRHLVRIAKQYGMNPFELCNNLAAITGFKAATVDYVLWRAANRGWI